MISQSATSFISVPFVKQSKQFCFNFQKKCYIFFNHIYKKIRCPTIIICAISIYAKLYFLTSITIVNILFLFICYTNDNAFLFISFIL